MLAATHLAALPLQAADLTAWMSRRSMAGDNPFEWLRAHLTSITPLIPVYLSADEIALMFDGSPLPPDKTWMRDAAAEAMRKEFVERGMPHYVPKPKIKKKHPKR